MVILRIDYRDKRLDREDLDGIIENFYIEKGELFDSHRRTRFKNP